MKKTKLLLILFFLAFSFSCSSDEQAGEPNNKIEEASLVSLGKEFKMKIHPEEDVDWYKVEVPKQGYLEVLARKVPENIDLHARFATYDEWNEEKEKFLTDYRKLPAASPVEKGTYYIKVADRYNENASKEKFDFKINFIEEFDEFESNNEVDQANKLEFEKEYQSAIFPKKDEDWFLTEVKEQGYLQIKAKDVPEDLELSAYVATYDEYAKEKENTIKSTTRLPFNVAIREPGEYYVVFKDRYNENSSKDKFTWRIDFLPEIDGYEPNDDFTQAKDIKLKTPVKLAIFPKGDRDFFKITPKRAGTLTIKAKDYKNVDLAASLFKPDPEDENKTVNLKGKTRFPVSFDLENPGQKYFIEIMDRYDNNANPELFEMIFELE
ncbi:MAG: hypothetical protein ACQEQC_08905 [Elusimicrobiota bacterium]